MRSRNFVLLFLGLAFIATSENLDDIDVLTSVDNGSDFTFNILGNTTEEDTLYQEKTDYSDETDSIKDQLDDRLPLGKDTALNVTFEEDGTPVVDVDSSTVDSLAALLMEHDERFHFDFPGHNTLLPQRTHEPEFEAETPNDESNNDTVKDESSENAETPERSSDDDITLSEDGHMFAYNIDPSLSGHVDIEDSADLAEMIVDKPPKLVRNRRAYFYPKGSRWPNGEYFYVFDRELNPQNRAWLLQAFKEIGSKVPCVKFKPATRGTKNYIIHTSKVQGCFASTLGMIPGKQSVINVGTYCDYPTTMHEVYHALGAIHTQSRPDRDNYVEINWQNIKGSSMNNFQKVNGRVTPETSEYDYKSTMHYPYFTGHAINPNVGSVRSRDRSVRLKKYGHYKFSEEDYNSLRKWYGCDAESNYKKSRGRNRPRPSWISSEDSIDCEVSPWGEWTWCSEGFKSRKRTIIQDAKGIGLPCPIKMIQRRLCFRNYVKRSAENTEREEEEKDMVRQELEKEEQVFDESDGNAVANLKKTVDVVEGTPIVLAVSNPQNLPIQWFSVINGEEQEIRSNSSDYTMSRTIAGNERLTVEVSSVEEHDELLIVTKILMRKSVLRIAWSIRVISEDEYLSRGEDGDWDEDFIEIADDEEEEYEDLVSDEDLLEEEEAWINEAALSDSEEDLELVESDLIDIDDIDEDEIVYDEVDELMDELDDILNEDQDEDLIQHLDEEDVWIDEYDAEREDAVKENAEEENAEEKNIEEENSEDRNAEENNIEEDKAEEGKELSKENNESNEEEIPDSEAVVVNKGDDHVHVHVSEDQSS